MEPDPKNTNANAQPPQATAASAPVAPPAPSAEDSAFQYSLAPKGIPPAKSQPVPLGQPPRRQNGALIYFGVIVLIILIGTAGTYFYFSQSAPKADISSNENVNTNLNRNSNSIELRN